MSCDLERLYGELAAGLPTRTDGEADPVLLTAATVPAPPATMTTDQLVVEVRQDGSSWHRVTLLDVDAASRATARAFGLLVLGVLLHPEPAHVDLRLTHEGTAVEVVRVRFEHQADPHWYFATPTAFSYSPGELGRHLYDEADHWDPVDLELTDNEELDHPNLPRTTAVVDGVDAGLVRLAEWFLNAGIPSNGDEFVLTSSAGFGGGLAPRSAHLRLEFEGADFWSPWWA